MNIALTGSNGFIGTHVRLYLHEAIKRGEVELVLIVRDDFDDASVLRDKLSRADLVLHCAGVNKGSDEELEDGNVRIAEQLRDALSASNSRAHIIYTSSTHEERNSAYGRGKKKAGELLQEFGKTNSSPVTTYILPHVFGEFAKPYYNSAVATFCEDIRLESESTVTPGGMVELVYVRDVVERMWEDHARGVTGIFRIEGQEKNIEDVYALLSRYAKSYREGIFPEFSGLLEQRLFNTLHVRLFDTMFPKSLETRSDERGALFELIRSNAKDQVFFSYTRPGHVRGQHYHTRKMERFCVVRGEGVIELRSILGGEVATYPVSGDNPVVIDMPTYVTHNLKNTGDSDLLALFWISEQFNPDDPDTYYEPV